MAETLYDGLCKIADLDREAFIFGNLKPDCTPKVLLRPHILTNYLDQVLELANHLMKDHMTREVFSEDMGELCHYLADFFCYYHAREEKFHHLVSHALYETRLQKYHQIQTSSFLKNILSFKVDPIENLKTSILNARAIYLSLPQSLDLDFFYAYRICKLACESIAYYQTGIIFTQEVIQEQAAYVKLGGLR